MTECVSGRGAEGGVDEKRGSGRAGERAASGRGVYGPETAPGVSGEREGSAADNTQDVGMSS